MQIKTFTLIVLISFFPILLCSSEQIDEKKSALKHRSYSCPQELLYKTDEIKDLLGDEVLPIKYAYSYKDPQQSYSPLRAMLQQEALKKSSSDISNYKEESNSQSKSDSEDSDCDKDFKDVDSNVDSDEEALFDIDDIDIK